MQTSYDVIVNLIEFFVPVSPILSTGPRKAANKYWVLRPDVVTILLKQACCIGRVTWRQCAQFYQRQRSLQRLRACSPPRSVHRKSVAMGRLTLPRRHWPQSTRAPHTARTSATACRYGSAFKHGAALPHWSAARSAPNAR